jgi:hypothetical protein
MKSPYDFFLKLKPLLEAEIAGVSVVFGAAHVGRRDNQGDPVANRVVIVPHLIDGTMSTTAPPKHVHRVPRDIGIERRWIVIDCWAYDFLEPENQGLQDEALQCLRQAVWRHTSFLVLSEGHAAMLEPPGIYSAQTKAFPSPSERVLGARSQTQLWIDFAVRLLEPTTVDQPIAEVTAEVVNP